MERRRKLAALAVIVAALGVCDDGAEFLAAAAQLSDTYPLRAAAAFAGDRGGGVEEGRSKIVMQQDVEELLDLRWNAKTGGYEVRVRWRGSDGEDHTPTWEPFQVMTDDIPEELERFLRDFPDQELANAAKESVKIE